MAQVGRGWQSSLRWRNGRRESVPSEEAREQAPLMPAPDLAEEPLQVCMLASAVPMLFALPPLTY